MRRVLPGIALLLMPACYDPPKPECGFRCGAGDACPDDYVCGGDRYCHLVGSPATACGTPGDAAGGLPFVVESVPADGAIDVTVAPAIAIRFSEDVVGVDATSFYAVTGGTPIAGTVRYEPAGVTAVFEPAAQLPAHADIRVTLTSGIRDLDGNALPVTELGFTTGADDVPPQIRTTSPIAGSTDVAADVAIVVTFDEPVLDVTTTTFVVDAGGAVTGTLALDDGGRRATFTAASPLPAATTVTVTLTQDITDAGGNALVPYQFTFTTS